MGRYKRAYIAALLQAKFYPPRRAAAATDFALRLPQCTRWNVVKSKICCRNAQAAMHKGECSLLCIAQYKPFYTVPYLSSRNY